MKKYFLACSFLLLIILANLQISCSSPRNARAIVTPPPEAASEAAGSDTGLEDVLGQLNEGNLLYFQGSFNMEWTWYINEIIEDAHGISYVFSTLREDLMDLRPMEDLIKPYILQLRNNSLLEEKKILLRAPLKEGEQWTSDWETRIGGFKGIAEVRIIKVSGDLVLTEAIIPHVPSFRSGFYRERNLFKKGYGLIAFACNTDYAEKGNFDFQMYVEKFADKPAADSSWITPWYLRPDKSQLKTLTDYYELLTSTD